jgi:hypothetical protein
VQQVGGWGGGPVGAPPPPGGGGVGGGGGGWGGETVPPPPRLCVCNLQTCWFVLTADMLAVFAGKQRRWDVIEAHSSVACVLYHKDMDAFLLVRQFRPAVYSCRLREAKEAGQPAPDRSAGRNSVCVGGMLQCVVSLLRYSAHQMMRHHTKV